MNPIPIGMGVPQQMQPEAKSAQTPISNLFFYGQTPAEKILTILQIAAALLTIIVAMRILLTKKS